MRPHGLILPLIAAAILASGLVSGRTESRISRAAGPKHTRTVTVLPFLASGRLASRFHAVQRVEGYCFESSIATTRSDAFRCFVGNITYDPCFRNPAGTRVACPAGLNVRQVVVIRLTEKLPQPGSGGPRFPWELKIASGIKCRFDPGATFVVDGKRANFSCSDQSWLFGEPKRRHEPWHISHGRGTHPKLKLVAIRTAWF